MGERAQSDAAGCLSKHCCRFSSDRKHGAVPGNKKRDMKPKILFLFLVLTMFCGPASSGSFLFYMAFASKSVKITFMPLAEELSKRGHDVTVVMPFASQEPVKGIKEIVAQSPIEEMLSQVGRLGHRRVRWSFPCARKFNPLWPRQRPKVPPLQRPYLIKWP